MCISMNVSTSFRTSMFAANLLTVTVVDAFAVLYDAIVEGTNPALGHGREGYYFASNGELSAYEIGQAIGSTLLKLGKVKSPEPTKLTDEELNKFFGPMVSAVHSTTQG